MPRSLAWAVVVAVTATTATFFFVPTIVVALSPSLAFAGGSSAFAAPRLLGLDQNGVEVTAERPGGWRLVFFGYTHCPDVCPLGLQTLAETMEALGPLADGFTPVFVTVDPARDTPAAMKDYASMFHPRLVGVTPTAEQLAEMAAAWRVKYDRVPSRDGRDYSIDHTAWIFLVDPSGAVLSRLPHDQSGARIADAIRAAMTKR
jgi:protein SCO1/2